MHRRGSDPIHSIHRWKFCFDFDSRSPGEHLSTRWLRIWRGCSAIKQSVVEPFECTVNWLETLSHRSIDSDNGTTQVKQRDMIGERVKGVVPFLQSQQVRLRRRILFIHAVQSYRVGTIGDSDRPMKNSTVLQVDTVPKNVAGVC